MGGKFQDSQLNQIAELATSESDLTTVQTFIKDIFDSLKPTTAHLLLPEFKWAGLATTNYDCLIEKSYCSVTRGIQTPKPFIENGDRVEDSMRDQSGVMLLKLHGCITRLTNPLCPLILATDQYITHRIGRSRIFDHLTDWAYEYPIIFVGYSLQDSDIRAIVQEMASIKDNRPRYYIVTPKMDDIEKRFWEQKRITPIAASFEDFMKCLDSKIPKTWRGLSIPTNANSHPIFSKVANANPTLSRNCQQFLDSDVEYIKAIKSATLLDPVDFYRGYSLEWAAIEQNLDVRRILADTILTDKILENEEKKPVGVEFILIKAHAGAGKSTLLKRIAWEAARDYDKLCLYLKPSGMINTAALQEIIRLCKERVFLFVDDIGDRVREIQSLIKNIEQFGKHLTIVGAERINEWNVNGQPIDDNLTAEYELKYLSNFEIEKLIGLLTLHKSLGTLEKKSLEDQKIAFSEIAGRQLLVALHEATLGAPFEDIIENEFANIVPLEAQKIYLTICVLNRLGVPVRAGIIARIHGIRFVDFQERLFKPLEHVVSASLDNVIRDYMYSARHPFIAEIVFDRVLKSPEEKYDHYIRCLNALNVDYLCDRKAYRQMIRGRTLLQMFTNVELVENIYKSAKEIGGEDSYYFHQKGLYEMHRGNLSAADILILKAEKLNPSDCTIKHSRSELLIKNAEKSRTQLEKEKFLKEATQIVSQIKRSKNSDESFAYHSLVKIDLVRLRDILSKPATDSVNIEIESVVKAIEKNLVEGLQLYPGDSFLLTAESDLATLINDFDRVVDSLKQAFEANARSTFVAFRLASHYEKNGKLAEAKSVLERALAANRNDRSLHYHFARYLMRHGSDNKENDEIVKYHLQHSFTGGDRNFDAQLLYGRQLYVTGNIDESKRVFGRLKDVRVSPDVKMALLYPLDDTFRGAVSRIEGNYIFVNRDGSSDWIYVHRDYIDDKVWEMLAIGTRCTYKIAFNFHGPGGRDLQLDLRS